MSIQEYKECVRRFIIENFLYGDDGEGFTDDASFLEEGIIDSTGVLELITFLEDEFHLQIDDGELVPENLDSVNNVAGFLAAKCRRAAG